MDKVLELARKSGLSVAEHFYAVAGSTDNLQKFYTLARADLEAELAGWKADQKENLANQCELQAEINQLRKERQAFKDVTEYQKSENAKLKSAMKNLLWYVGQLEMIAYTNEEGDHEYVEAARAALGETKC